MIPTAKYSLLGQRVLAAIVVLITSAVVVNSTTSLTVPNAATYPYTLPANGTFNVGVPAIDRPVLFMGVCTTSGVRGVSHLSLLRVSEAPGMLIWNGQESTSGDTTSSYGATPGQHMAFLDFNSLVHVEVLSATAFRIRNGAAGVRAGAITMIW